ncbi:MAG: hypothetical protein WBP95_20245, partial [Acidobacteriaceae bacterium]
VCATASIGNNNKRTNRSALLRILNLLPKQIGLEPLSPSIAAPPPALKRNENPPNGQMWKTCQEAEQKSKVMTPHNTPLTSLYPQSILAVFSAGLGILIIGGKKEIPPPD